MNERLYTSLRLPSRKGPQRSGVLGEEQMSETTTGSRQRAAGDGHDRTRFSDPARRLLQAANDLFCAQGFQATTVREITGACGLSPGAMYNHFTSKEELLYVLVRHMHDRIEEDVVAAQALVAGDPAAELVAIVGVYVRAHVGGRRGAMVANREYRHLTGSQLAEVVAIRRRLRDRVVTVLREGVQAGVFDTCGGSDMGSLTLTAATVLEMCINSSQWINREGALSVEELEQRFADFTLRLVGYRQSA